MDLWGMSPQLPKEAWQLSFRISGWGGFPGSPRRALCDLRSLYEGSRGVGESKRPCHRLWRWRQGSRATERRPLEREAGSPRSPQKERSPAARDFSPVRPRSDPGPPRCKVVLSFPARLHPFAFFPLELDRGSGRAGFRAGSVFCGTPGPR